MPRPGDINRGAKPKSLFHRPKIVSAEFPSRCRVGWAELGGYRQHLRRRGPSYSDTHARHQPMMASAHVRKREKGNSTCMQPLAPWHHLAWGTRSVLLDPSLASLHNVLPCFTDQNWKRFGFRRPTRGGGCNQRYWRFGFPTLALQLHWPMSPSLQLAYARASHISRGSARTAVAPFAATHDLLNNTPPVAVQAGNGFQLIEGSQGGCLPCLASWLARRECFQKG